MLPFIKATSYLPNAGLMNLMRLAQIAYGDFGNIESDVRNCQCYFSHILERSRL